VTAATEAVLITVVPPAESRGVTDMATVAPAPGSSVPMAQVTVPIDCTQVPCVSETEL
jgi:hypothetical protein